MIQVPTLYHRPTDRHDLHMRRSILVCMERQMTAVYSEMKTNKYTL
jgi:hypothetical protein